MTTKDTKIKDTINTTKDIIAKHDIGKDITSKDITDTADTTSKETIGKIPPATTQGLYCPVGWGCKIHRLHICRGG